MSARLVEAGEIRQSRRIATVAAALDMDESQVRRLVDIGQLEAHGVGKRGVRVYLDSVADYQARQARTAPHAPDAGTPRRQAPRRTAANTAAHRAALAELRRDGLIH